MKTLKFKLKAEWEQYEDLESAIWTKVQELWDLARRQGAERPRMDRIAPAIANMFEPLTTRTPKDS